MTREVLDAINARRTLADTIHAAGENVPKNLTPPSERPHKVPNRADRRANARRGAR